MLVKFKFLAAFEGNNDGSAGGNSGGDGGAGGIGDSAGAGAGNGLGAGGSAGSGAGKGGRTFTQEEVNKFLADDRRKHTEKYTALEKSYQDLLENQNLSKEERTRLEDQLEDLRKQQRTKEQQLAYEKKQAEEKYQAELKQWQEKAGTWESRYTESTITQALQSAAIKHDAFNPQQVIVQLRNQTKLVEKLDHVGKPTGKLVPMVEMSVKNEDSGAVEQLQMTPDEAVEYMKKNPEQWGNFFRHNIREGIGSSSATGAFAGDGTVDHSKLSDEQWFKLRKENPAALGLKNRR